MRRKLVVGMILPALLAGSCVMSTIEGAGDTTAETRQVSGSGTVRYFGEPRVTESISGSGTLDSVGPRGPSFQTSRADG